MANQTTPFKLDTKDVVFVKPSNPIPSSILSLTHIDNRPDVNALCPMVYVYRPTNHHDSPNNQLDPFIVIKEALSKALLYYYPLAGRLVKHDDGKFRVHFNEEDHGVPFVEAVANCHLSSLDYLDGDDIEIAKHLAFDLPLQDQNGHQYPLLFKVTKFLCGGFTIGWSVSHNIVDGFGGAQFFRAFAELASGKNEPSVKPVWEREKILDESIPTQPFQHPMGDAKAANSPLLPSPTTDFIHASFKVDLESITRLKTSLMKESSSESETMKQSFTTFESLTAYVWRARARALNLSNDGKTVLIFLVGVRMHLVDPPLPEGYYGNAFVDAYVPITVKELNEKPLYEIAKLIRVNTKGASTSDYMKKFINTIRPSKNEFNIFGGAYTAVTDWRHVGFLENMDLGENKLVNAVPAPRDNFGTEILCIFCTPSYLDPSMKGGLRVFTSLPSAAMLKFKEEMEALKTIG